MQTAETYPRVCDSVRGSHECAFLISPADMDSGGQETTLI